MQRFLAFTPIILFLKFPLFLIFANLVPHRFKVEDEKYAKDTACAWACIRLDRLQQGYRFVHLMDMKGQATQGLLFVKIEKSLRPVENVKIIPVVAK